MTAAFTRRSTGIRWSGLAAVLALVLGQLVVTGGGYPPAAQAASPPATITISTLTPDTATAGTLLRVAGRVANTGKQALRNVEVRLRLSDTRLGSRAELAAVVDGRTTSRDGAAVVTRNLPDLAVGQTTDFDVSRPVIELDALTTSGVYVVGVEVLASRSSGFGRVAIVRTLLPWVPEEPDFQPTGYSWLWPLVSRPTRMADGTFAEDTLAVEMGPGGRLTNLLAAGEQLQDRAALTWVVDPELISAAEDMADGYEVLGPDGSRLEGGGSGLAGLWLDRLRAATAGRRVLALPYADPDVTALNRAGMRADIPRATEAAEATLAEVLPLAAPVPAAAWPMDGYVNRGTLTVLRRVGATAVVLDGRAVPTEIDLSYTPSGRAHVASGAGRVEALLAEPGLADLLRDRGPNPVLGAQRFLAETAMITSELPSTGTERVILVVPPRRWDPDPAFLDRISRAVPEAPWMAPVPFAELVASEPPEVDRQPLHYPAAQRRRELPAATYLSAVRGMRTSISLLSAILTDRSELIPELDRSVLGLESTYWRGKAGRTNRLDREEADLTALRGSVTVQPGNFTFSSRQGTIPVTIANGLDQEVEVGLRLEPQTPRLRVENTQSVRIGPRSKLQVPVRATAVASGPVVVAARLHTPGGAAYGQPVPLRITITQYGTVALYITAGAAAVLFLTAGFRVLRRLLAARRRSAQGPGQPPDTDTQRAPGDEPSEVAR
ncbi:MAG TPA: DUF6049 family protein [Actinomycetes bacterium]